MYAFVSQPVFKMETYEGDMEIAEVNKGFVYLQVICYIFFAVDESLNVQTRSQSVGLLSCIVVPRATRPSWPLEPWHEARVAVERFDWLDSWPKSLTRSTLVSFLIISSG